jgi:hypothetical protein
LREFVGITHNLALTNEIGDLPELPQMDMNNFDDEMDKVILFAIVV